MAQTQKAPILLFPRPLSPARRNNNFI
uniref:Uncharacterized protein n=1 Tax=Anguilla anguilla TaxID=7936 RepID=A0A0E9RBW5_ANGAN